MGQDQEWQRLVDRQKAAEQLEREGRYVDAVQVYTEIVSREPAWGNGWAFLALAELHEKLNQMDAAEECFLKSVEHNIDPPNPNYRSNCAAFLLERGKPAKALEYFSKALSAAVALGMSASIPDIISGMRASGERIPLSKGQVDAMIDSIRGTTGKTG